MGWNSWNRFGCDVNETLIRETADAMVTTGLAALGYEYVNVDGQTHECRQIGSVSAQLAHSRDDCD